MMHIRNHRPLAGTTLVETLIAVMLLAVFFLTLFEVNAACLHYISASKENISGIECVQDRLEQLRGTDFTSMLTESYMDVTPAVVSPQRRNLTVPSNGSDLASYATEVVKISTYSGTGATTPSVTYTRVPGAKINLTTPYSDTNVAPSSAWSGGSSFPATTTTVQVDVTYSWNSVFGGRPRSTSSSTIISAGTKK